MRFLVVGAGRGGRRSRASCSTASTTSCSRAASRAGRNDRATGRNPRYLQNVDLSAAEAVALEDAPRGCRRSSSWPCRAASSREVVERLPGDAPVLSLTKGLDPETGERLSTRVRGRSVAVLSGPNIAEEIAAGLPTAAVIASDDGCSRGQLQHAINSSLFRVYVIPTS